MSQEEEKQSTNFGKIAQLQCPVIPKYVRGEDSELEDGELTDQNDDGEELVSLFTA